MVSVDIKHHVYLLSRLLAGKHVWCLFMNIKQNNTGTQPKNLLRLLATMNRVIYLILWSHTGNCIHQN